MKYLSSDPKIMGGDLVIKGTRIPIDVVLFRLKDGYSMREIHNMYPTPTMATLNGAVTEAIDLLTTQFHGEKIL